MTWTCPKCGYDRNQDKNLTCSNCYAAKPGANIAKAAAAVAARGYGNISVHGQLLIKITILILFLLVFILVSSQFSFLLTGGGLAIITFGLLIWFVAKKLPLGTTMAQGIAAVRTTPGQKLNEVKVFINNKLGVANQSLLGFGWAKYGAVIAIFTLVFGVITFGTAGFFWTWQFLVPVILAIILVLVGLVFVLRGDNRGFLILGVAGLLFVLGLIISGYLGASLLLPLSAIVIFSLAISNIGVFRSIPVKISAIVIAILLVLAGLIGVSFASIYTFVEFTPWLGRLSFINYTVALILFAFGVYFILFKEYRDDSGRRSGRKTGFFLLGLSALVFFTAVVNTLFGLARYLWFLAIGGAIFATYKIWTVNQTIRNTSDKWSVKKRVLWIVAVWMAVAIIGTVYGLLTNITVPGFGWLLNMPRAILAVVSFIFLLLGWYLINKSKSKKKNLWYTLWPILLLLINLLVTFKETFTLLTDINYIIAASLLALAFVWIYYIIRFSKMSSGAKFLASLGIALIPLIFFFLPLFTGVQSFLVYLQPLTSFFTLPILLGGGVVLYIVSMLVVNAKISKEKTGLKRTILYGSAAIIAFILLFLYFSSFGTSVAILSELSGDGRYIVAIVFALFSIPFFFVGKPKDKALGKHWWMGVLLLLLGSGMIWVYPSISQLTSVGLLNFSLIYLGFYSLLALCMILSLAYKKIGLFFVFAVIGVVFWFVVPFFTSEIIQSYALKGEIAAREAGIGKRLERFWFYVKNPEKYFASFGEFTNPQAKEKKAPVGLNIENFKPVVGTFRSDQEVRFTAEAKNYALPKFEEGSINVNQVSAEFGCVAISEDDKSLHGEIEIKSSAREVETNVIPFIDIHRNTTFFVFCNFNEGKIKNKKDIEEGKAETKKATLSASYSNFVTESVLKTYILGKEKYEEINKKENRDLEFLNEMRSSASYPGLINNERKTIS